MSGSTVLAALIVVSAALIGVASVQWFGLPLASSSSAASLVGPGSRAFDDKVPAVSNLDPRMRRALHQAATDAGREGIEISINSGWRSAKYQEQLLREAVSKHGSVEKARRWVATADTSAHVSGRAVDIGPPRATAWLSRHGATYGLCQIYRNEPWHYELRSEAADDGCPLMYANPGVDPRMQR